MQRLLRKLRLCARMIELRRRRGTTVALRCGLPSGQPICAFKLGDLRASLTQARRFPFQIREPGKLARDSRRVERNAAVAQHRDHVKDDASGGKSRKDRHRESSKVAAGPEQDCRMARSSPARRRAVFAMWCRLLFMAAACAGESSGVCRRRPITLQTSPRGLGMQHVHEAPSRTRNTPRSQKRRRLS